MSIAVPIFFFYSCYSIVIVYLPVFFRMMGYSSSTIGYLLSAFEISGIIFSFLLCKLPSKSGKYGLWLLFFGCILCIIPYPMLKAPFAISFIMILLYGIPVKATIPISDTFVNVVLGEKRDNYGKIRACGSVGFVITSFIFQYFVKPETLPLENVALVMAVPPLFLCLSLLLFPKLLKPHKTLDLSHIELVDSDSPDDGSEPFFKQFSPLFWLIMVVTFLGNMALYSSTKFFSLYIAEYLHSDAFATLWSFSAIAEIPALFFSYVFIRRFGSKNIILFCTGMIFIRLIVYVVFPTTAGVAFSQILHFFTFGLLHPALVVFVTQEVSPKKLVIGQTIYSVGVNGVATVLGSTLGGILIENFGYLQYFTVFSFLPLIGLVLYFFIVKFFGKTLKIT